MKITQQQIVGVVLWWAEGSKSRKDPRWKNVVTYPIEITNTDPKIISAFLVFLIDNYDFDTSRIKLQLQIHEGDDQVALEAYWAGQTGIPRERFNKTIIRPVGNKVGKSKGTCKIRFNDKKIYQSLENLLSQVLDNL